MYSSTGSVGRTIRVVLVDDHPIVLDGLRARVGTARQIEVVGAASSGAQALELVRFVGPEVMLVDIGMEDMTGISLTSRLSQEYPAIRVLILSMHNRPIQVSNAIKAGARGYVLKGSDSHEIITGIEVIAGGGTYFGRGVSLPIAASGDPAQRPTPTEFKVLQLLAHGYRNKDVAVEMGISVKTAERHRQNLRTKLNLDTIIDMRNYLEGQGWPEE